MTESVRPKIKFCGFTRIEDALFAAYLGVDALGFIFYPKSPRYISPQDAGRICDSLPPFLSRVGVFVNASREEILTTIREAKLSSIQLHGDEELPFCESMQKNISVIKALRISSEKDLDQIRYFQNSQLSAILLDSKVEEVYGGSGHRINEQLLKQVDFQRKSTLIAGGINAENIGSLYQNMKPYGFDLSSGIESAPGKKDEMKMRSILEKRPF